MRKLIFTKLLFSIILILFSGFIITCGDGSKENNNKTNSTKCPDSCEQSGSKRCKGTTIQICMDENKDGCPEWLDEENCKSPLICMRGECVENESDNDSNTDNNRDNNNNSTHNNINSQQCEDECEEYAAECVGDKIRYCENIDSDPCLEWQPVEECWEGAVCKRDLCTVLGECADDCEEGVKKCTDDNTYQICEYNFANGCIEWGTNFHCSDDMICIDGDCKYDCVDECEYYEKTCEDNGFKRCGNYDLDLCREWSDVTPCGENETCENGECVEGCHSGCEEDETVCAPDFVNGYLTCKDYNSDGCFEWSQEYEDLTLCEHGKLCEDGQCIFNCSDECDEGSSRCVSLEQIERCGNHDDDECLEWSEPTDCYEDMECFAGRCQ